MTSSNISQYDDLFKPTKLLSLSKTFLSSLLFLNLTLFTAGGLFSLILAPTDSQQGEIYRIIYFHVPCAWLTTLLYFGLTILSGLFLITKNPLLAVVAKSIAKVGLLFTALTLITGSLWGAPTWGTYWVWDARLTSVLVLFFIYLGYLNIVTLAQKEEQGIKLASIFALIGFINIPIIKFSVDWWNTLHQPATITKLSMTLHSSMLVPLNIMAISLTLSAIILTVYFVRYELLTKRTRYFNLLNL